MIAADGLALMPGIIDSHTHFDAQITWDPTCRPSPALGVTTAVIGNCGFTIAPCRPQDRDITMRNLTQVEGMSLDVLRQGIAWEFETFPEYLAQLRRKGSAVNIAAYIGHSGVRTYVMGDDASRRAATDVEIEQMQTIVREAMRAGAVGFASSTSARPQRRRRPADALAPGRRPRDAGAGHGDGRMRPRRLHADQGRADAGAVSRIAGCRQRPPGDGRRAAAQQHQSAGRVRRPRRNRRRQHARPRLIGQVSCCPLTMDFTMQSPYPVEGLKSWKPALGAHGDALKAMLASRDFRDGVRAELATTTNFRLFNGEWDKVQVVEVAQPEHAALEQKGPLDAACLSGCAASTTWTLSHSLLKRRKVVGVASSARTPSRKAGSASTALSASPDAPSAGFQLASPSTG